MPEFPELPGAHELAGEADEGREQRFTRLAAVAIVLTTLAAATTAYLQASALGANAGASARATELATAAQGARNQSNEAAQMLVDRYDVAQQQRARAAAAEQQAFFGPASRRAGLAAERSRWLRVAAQTERNTRTIAAGYGLLPVSARGPLGPARDRFFPAHYLASSRREAYRLGALRDGANREADEADAQVGRYAISLTVFTVAVFLFGYSLTPHARRRRGLFAGTATVFVVGGAALAVAIARNGPQLPPTRAAGAFADGRVAYDSESFPLAVRDFTRAIAAWPDYAPAHTLRARAEFSAGSPQLDVPLSLTSPAALASSVADEQRAIDLGARDSGLLVSAGYDLFALGLRRHDTAMIERGLSYSREAAAALPTDPVSAFNAGVALLALGRLNAARAAYDQAVSRTIFVDRAHRVRRNDKVAYEYYLAEALTDIDSVAARRGPRLGAAITQIKRAIVASITRAAYGESLNGRGPQDASASGLSLDVGPAFTLFRIARAVHIGYYADLSVQWYFQAPGGLGLEVLPDVSGAVIGSPGADAGTPGEGVNGDGMVFDRAGYLSATGSCLSPGRYRLEVYVNGRLIATAGRQVAFPALVAGRLRDLGLAFCRPKQWRPMADSAPGLLDGYLSPDRRAGMVVFSINRQVAGAGGPSRALSRRILAVALQRFASRLPAGLSAGDDTTQSFMGLAGGLVRTYRYPGGSALAGAGAATNSGQLLVAVAFGPRALFAAQETAIFASLATEG
ncbi:MAG: hypothetical protein M3071_03745 [Actinomycetota bacterium]|nr:hypothetical protein [Actinomycetota bacterium]